MTVAGNRGPDRHEKYHVTQGVVMQEDKDDFPIGTRFGDAGRYEIREPIGRGAMADVYKAVDTQLNNRLCAVKILSRRTEGHANAAKLRQLFIEEARALSRIRDTNVIAVITNGCFSDATSTPYMVMEYLHGRDLSALLQEDKQLAVERAVDIILAICAGIHACHTAGVIHRDLKPANIFLDQTLKGEEVKVLDFSVAKVPISTDQTKTDFVIGTESYMAPEQANGRPANEKSDEYSIGALLYRCLTGQVPRGFLSKPREVRTDIPELLETAILRAMDPKPDHRFDSVYELGRNLVGFASSTGRAKWKHYYTTPPLPMRAAFTGPIPMGPTAGPGLGILEAILPTTSLTPYDFKAHERPTRVAAELSTDDANTILDRPPEGPPTVETAPPTDVDRPLEMCNPTVGPDAPVEWTEARESERSSSLLARTTRPRMLLIAGAAALLMACAGLALTITFRRTHTLDHVPTPPAWTRTSPAAAPARAPVTPAAPGATPPRFAGPPAVSPALPSPPPPKIQPAPEPEPAQSVPSVAPVREKKHRRLRVRDAVTFTPEGIPIMR